MKTTTCFQPSYFYISLTALLIAFLLSTLSLFAQDGEEIDKTLSPYFFVMSEDTTLDQMPLKSTSANINISGVIADVTVKQIYHNEGEKTLFGTISELRQACRKSIDPSSSPVTNTEHLFKP